jgi:AcrR family transcriptional regulator
MSTKLRTAPPGRGIGEIDALGAPLAGATQTMGTVLGTERAGATQKAGASQAAARVGTADGGRARPVPGAETQRAQAEAPSGRRLSARERLLAAADELFYENGINTVGIDRVIEHAGVAKASLYDCFGSKEELVRAYLQRRGERRRALVEERMSKYDTPEEKILSVFDLLGETIALPGYRGCSFVRASADANSSERVKGACDESRAFLLNRFTELAREARVADPELIGKQLVLLYDGASATAYMDADRNAATLARALAAQLLSNAGR